MKVFFFPQRAFHDSTSIRLEEFQLIIFSLLFLINICLEECCQRCCNLGARNKQMKKAKWQREGASSTAKHVHRKNVECVTWHSLFVSETFGNKHPALTAAFTKICCRTTRRWFSQPSLSWVCTCFLPACFAGSYFTITRNSGIPPSPFRNTVAAVSIVWGRVSAASRKMADVFLARAHLRHTERRSVHVSNWRDWMLKRRRTVHIVTELNIEHPRWYRGVSGSTPCGTHTTWCVPALLPRCVCTDHQTPSADVTKE